MKEIIGLILLALPFLAIFAFTVSQGWRCVVFVWGALLGILLCLGTGAYLLSGGV